MSFNECDRAIARCALRGALGLIGEEFVQVAQHDFGVAGADFTDAAAVVIRVLASRDPA